MTVPTDPYNFTNGTTADGDQVDARFAPLYAALNGAVDVDNLLPAVKDKLGLSDAGTVRRGKSIIAASEARTNVAYGLMTTPDRVQNVVVPADGLLHILYRARWGEAVTGAARAAVFIGATRLRAGGSGLGASLQQAAKVPGGAEAAVLRTCPIGLIGVGVPAANSTLTLPLADGTFVFDGTQVAHDGLGGLAANGVAADLVGGELTVQVAAGTYDVSVQFLASSGSVTAWERSLRVWTTAF